MDVCMNCGSSQFEEENGLYFCLICQTQRLGRTQEVAQDFETQDVETGEVKQKRKKKVISTGVLWTTPEAFNYILFDQVKTLIDSGVVSNDYKEMVMTIWFAYLKYCEILSSSDKYEKTTPKLHSAARFRDIQIVRTLCDEVPLYKYAKSSNPKRRRIRFGNRVLQTNLYNATISDDESGSEDNLKYGTVRIKRNTSSRLFSSEIRQKIRSIVYNGFCDSNEIFDTESSNDEEDFLVTERCKKLKTVYNSGYLSSTKHIHSSNDCFIGILTLPRTIAILSLAFRLCNKNIFTCDIMLWIKQGYIPYFNTLLSLPATWKILSSDCRTFVPTTSPTSQNIDSGTVKVAGALKIKSLPAFNFFALIGRYVEDLNLPMIIVDIMKFQDVFNTHIFSEKLYKKVYDMRILPPFEVISLMSIVLLLKRLFGLDGKSEKYLSNIARNSSSNFVWKDWESYTRLRLDLLKHYYVPIHEQKDSIRDICSVVSFYSEVAEHWRPKDILSNKKDESPFRNNIRNLFQTISSKYISKNFETRSPELSVFHLTSATNAIGKRIGSNLKNKLNVDFRNKDLSYMEKYCVVYSPLKIGSAGRDPTINVLENWSQSFILLLELSCLILQCKTRDLFIVLNQMEKTFLKHYLMRRKA